MSDWLRAQWDYTVITPPEDDVVTVEKAKEFMKIDFADEDTLIASLITAATELAQKITRRVFLTTGFRTFRNGFGESRHYTSGGELPIVLRRSPFIASSLLKYKTATGETSLVKDTDYFEEIVGDYSKLRPENFWPTDNKQRVQSVTIEFTAGYGDDTDVPEDIKLAILQHVNFLYSNRGDCGCDEASASVSGAMNIYQKYRIIEV